MTGKLTSLNLRYLPHFLVGFVLSLWLYLFLVLVGPFDAAEIPLNIRFILMPGYGLAFFLAYAILIPIQNSLYGKLNKWNPGLEIAMVVLFCAYNLPLNYLYYKSGIVNGDFNFSQFTLTIYLPMIAIIMPVIFVGRYLIAPSRKRDQAPAPDLRKTVTLRGDNKLDILRISMADLIAFEAANNYVTVYYITNDRLEKKLLRTSLRKLHGNAPKMVQVHRSYLINQQHFIEWKDALTLGMTHLTVPVSQKYKPLLLSMPTFTPNEA